MFASKTGEIALWRLYIQVSIYPGFCKKAAKMDPAELSWKLNILLLLLHTYNKGRQAAVGCYGENGFFFLVCFVTPEVLLSFRSRWRENKFSKHHNCMYCCGSYFFSCYNFPSWEVIIYTSTCIVHDTITAISFVLDFILGWR